MDEIRFTNPNLWPEDGPKTLAEFDQAFADFNKCVDKLIKGAKSDPSKDQYTIFKELVHVSVIARDMGWPLTGIIATAIIRLADLRD